MVLLSLAELECCSIAAETTLRSPTRQAFRTRWIRNLLPSSQVFRYPIGNLLMITSSAIRSVTVLACRNVRQRDILALSLRHGMQLLAALLPMVATHLSGRIKVQ